jgi:hypothetical protein
MPYTNETLDPFLTIKENDKRKKDVEMHTRK